MDPVNPNLQSVTCRSRCQINGALDLRRWRAQQERMTDTSPEKTIRAHVLIAGRVQGVSFRWYTQRKAQELGLTGWVRNLWDRRVEAVFEGEEDAVRKAVNWCPVGPPTAYVEDVQVNYETPTGEFTSFRVKYL